MADDPEDPEVFEGVLALEWHKPLASGPQSPLVGWGLTVTEAHSGKSITTITDVTVKAPVKGMVTADVTMFADEDGRPIYEGKAQLENGEFRQEVFRFIVASLGTVQSVPV